jgi:hypothetical protein
MVPGRLRDSGDVPLASSVPRRRNIGRWDFSSGKMKSSRPFNINTGSFTRGAKLTSSISDGLVLEGEAARFQHESLKPRLKRGEDVTESTTKTHAEKGQLLAVQIRS